MVPSPNASPDVVPDAVAQADLPVVDARGHSCPTPTLRLKRALEAAAAGGSVVLLADDPLARIDVPHFVQAAGHILVGVQADRGALRFTVRKGPAR